MGFTSGSGSSTSLSSLTDIIFSNTTNLQVLSYNSSTSKWQNSLVTDLGALTAGTLDSAVSNVLASSTSATVASLNSSYALTSVVAAKYTFPSGGIPQSDLASAVSTKLDNAATALSTAQSAQTTANAAYVKPGGGIPESDMASAVATKLENVATALSTAQSAQTTANAAYVKPSTGIPETDMASAVTTKLDNVATALSNASAAQTTASAAYVKPSSGIPLTDLSTTAQNSIALPANYSRTQKPANTSVTSSSTIAADPDLAISVVANGKYVFEMLLVYEADNAGDIKLGIAAPTGSTVFAIGNGVASDTTLTTAVDSPMTIQYVHTINSGYGAAGGVGAGTPVGYRLSGTLTVGSTAGTFGLSWAQNTSSTVATILYAGSEFSATRIS